MLDFAAIKKGASIEQVLTMLGIATAKCSNGQLRGKCPICDGNNPRAFVVTPDKNLFYSFCDTCRCGGDQIELVARVRQVPTKDAARLIAEHFAAPQKPRDALEPLDHLDPTHEAVTAFGIPPAMAASLGIGYAKRGVLRGSVGFPIRTSTGELLGYIGVKPGMDIIVPKSLR